MYQKNTWESGGAGEGSSGEGADTRSGEGADREGDDGRGADRGDEFSQRAFEYYAETSGSGTERTGLSRAKDLLQEVGPSYETGAGGRRKMPRATADADMRVRQNKCAHDCSLTHCDHSGKSKMFHSESSNCSKRKRRSAISVPNLTTLGQTWSWKRLKRLLRRRWKHRRRRRKEQRLRRPLRRLQRPLRRGGREEPRLRTSHRHQRRLLRPITPTTRTWWTSITRQPCRTSASAFPRPMIKRAKIQAPLADEDPPPTGPRANGCTTHQPPRSGWPGRHDKRGASTPRAARPTTSRSGTGCETTVLRKKRLPCLTTGCELLLRRRDHRYLLLAFLDMNSDSRVLSRNKELVRR